MTFIDRKVTRPGTTRRVRMDGHDYAYPGYYFVTICTHGRQMLLGHIEDGSIIRTSAGMMVESVIAESETRFSTVTIDSQIVMPNHVHVLIGLAIGLEDDALTENLSDIVRWIKNATHRRSGIGVTQAGWQPYRGKLWQKSFHDHIVRGEKELETLRNYIATNVVRWGEDAFYEGSP